jgi:hypothetical protein
MGSKRSVKGWFVRALWDRVVSNYNWDADVWWLGVWRTIDWQGLELKNERTAG